MYGVAESIEHLDTLKGIRFDTVIDVGANRGQFSLLMSRLNPQAKIFAFEPLSKPFSVYQKILGAVDRVKCYNCAIGETAGEVTVNISARDDSSSLLEIGSGQISEFPGTGKVEEEVVKIVSLSSFLSPPDLSGTTLLKIDVQGYELSVLLGTDGLLPEISYIYLECSLIELYVNQALFNDLHIWLTTHGFFLYNIGPLHQRHARLIQGDFLYKNCNSI